MEAISILALQKMPGVGATTIEKVLSLPDIIEPSTPSDLIGILKEAKAKFGRISVPDIQAATIGWNQAHEIWELSSQHNIQIISKNSSDYPKFLLQISDPPALLHIKGNIGALNKDCIAIVGTRNPTIFGLSQAKKFGESFAKEGYMVVSGLAKGIDSAAHKGALKSNGLTVAVLAHGLDTVYPSENKPLAENIIENNGALVSEYPWGTKSNRSSFVSRNRIQSGLSLAVLVVETNIKGGTMHTVRFCEKQNRSLIVLRPPKDLIENSNTQGNTQLISEERADMVLEENNGINLVTNKMKNIKDMLSELEHGQIGLLVPMERSTNQKTENIKNEYINSVPSQQIVMHHSRVHDKKEKYITKTLDDYTNI